MALKKLIILLFAISIITSVASASTTVTVKVKRIQSIDQIEGFGENEADWYYHIGLWNGKTIEWKSSQVYVNGNGITLSDSYTFTTSTLTPNVKIVLCEEDDISSDDIADVSSSSSGGQKNVASYIEPGIWGGMFNCYYYLINNELGDGDSVIVDSTYFNYYKSSGDFDNSVGEGEDEYDASVWFSISDNYNLPTADAGNRLSSKVRDLVNFNGIGTASSGSTIAKYQWDFNNDGIFDAEGQTTSYTYTKAGTYTVKLKVTDNYDQVATDTMIVTINTVQPIAGFVFSPSSPYTSDTITFTDTSTDQDGTISSWYWNFGDGITSKEKNPSHKYNDDGSYTVKLKVTDNDGATNTKSATIKVKNIKPDAKFSFSPSDPTTNNDIQFTDSSSDKDGKISSWFWDFGDGYTSKNKNPSHKYQNTGSFKVKLRVTDDDSDSDDYTKSITISKPSIVKSVTSAVLKQENSDETSSTPGFGIIIGITNVVLVFFIRRANCK